MEKINQLNVTKSVNPNQCHFIVTYSDGKIIKGKNLFDTGWEQIPDGLSRLEFVLSTGEIMEIPKFKAYLLEIKSSLDEGDGHRTFHSAAIKCLDKEKVLIYRIILREDSLSKLKIGDVVVGNEDIPEEFSGKWKFVN